MATKRRKVWVNFYGGDRMDEVYRSRSTAIDSLVVGEDAEDAVVPFIERLPGDVVLSREEVDAITLRLARAELAVGLEYLPWHDSTEGSPEQTVVKDALEALKQIGALLRGRR